LTRVKVTDIEEHASLLLFEIEYGCKKAAIFSLV
jgi:hypothetical protein